MSLSLALSMVVVASLVGHAQASYYCYPSWNSESGYVGSYWYSISARAYGCFYVPSDGNLYDTWGGGGGFTDAPLAEIYNRVRYVERGCAGDWFYSETVIGIDRDGYGRIDYRDSVVAVVKAPPCGAT